MFSASECSAQNNALSRLAKVGHQDKTLQNERWVAGRAPVGVEGGLRTGGGELVGADKQLADNFFAQQAATSNAFALDDMRRAVEEMHHHAHPVGVPAGAMGTQWASEFGALPMQEQIRIQQQAGPGFNPAEFAEFQQQAQQAQQMSEARMVSTAPVVGASQPQFYRPQFQGYQHFNGAMGMQNAILARLHLAQQQPIVQQEKGKGKMVDLDDQSWERHFAEVDNVQQIDDEALNKAIDAQLQSGDTVFEDFQKVWDDLRKDQEKDAQIDINSDWVSEFDSQKPWTPDLSHTKSMPNEGDYLFEQDNPYMTLDDPFLEGKRLMETGGNLSLAALAFEAAVQKNGNHVEAWTMLGNCQAQNEKETPAIRALEKALQLEPRNLEAMMGLAVSYTNEGYDTTAYSILERWISTKYPELTKDLPPTTKVERQALQDRVTELFISAAQLSPEGQQMDSDVQVGLGVLFYGAEEYDKAVDCFNAALACDYDARDKNHLLWNRLGATLANSGRSEEAINAYERALTINPNFVRARYNLGVSCINIGCFEQAAQHLLGALAMHKVAEDKAREDARNLGMDPDRITHNQSTNLFDTLRRVFVQMNRKDLADMVNSGMDVDMFRGEFEF